MQRLTCYSTSMRTGSPETFHLPEREVEVLARRLNRQNTLNANLLILPPLVVLLYAVFALFLAGLAGVAVLVFSAAAIFAISLVALFHPRTTLPQAKQLGRMIDEKVGGVEHFVTLATIDPHRCSPPLLDRLRRQASQLLNRLNLRRDFPYRVKRGSLLSLASSLLVIVLVHWLLQYPVLSVPDQRSAGKLSSVAQELSRQGVGGIARGAEKVAGLVREQLAELPALKEWVQTIEDQMAGNLSGDEQQSGGSEQHEGNQQGSDGALADKPGEQDGEGGAAQGGREGKGHPRTEEADGLEQGKASSGEEQQGKLAGTGPQEGGEGDRSREDDRQRKHKEPRPRENGGGHRRRSEEIPKGEEPERFYRPGENRERGLKGSRFVNVELPETVASGGTEVSSRAGGEGSSAQGAPVSVKNIPLASPRDTGVVEAEQRVPLEYENLIR